jgi:hypothetical protein
MDNDRKCFNCEYWQSNEPSITGSGNCHFNPPIPLMVEYKGKRPKTDEPIVGHKLQFLWPATIGVDWCSHFLKKK